ncbi:MAG TPA: DUF202 domain-containing protein [Thermoanaerobaculia bacterium]
MIDPTDPRILFAAERTLLAWIRTGVAIMAFGFAIAHLQISLLGGVALVILGALLNCVGAFEYAGITRRLRSGDATVPERPIQVATAVAVLLAVAGLIGAGFLLA